MADRRIGGGERIHAPQGLSGKPAEPGDRRIGVRGAAGGELVKRQAGLLSRGSKLLQLAQGLVKAAAEALKLNAATLEELGVVDEVVAEPFGGAQNDPVQAAAALKYALQKHLNDLRALDATALVNARYERYRHLGSFEEGGVVHN